MLNTANPGIIPHVGFRIAGTTGIGVPTRARIVARVRGRFWMVEGRKGRSILNRASRVSAC